MSQNKNKNQSKTPEIKKTPEVTPPATETAKTPEVTPSAKETAKTPEVTPPAKETAKTPEVTPTLEVKEEVPEEDKVLKNIQKLLPASSDKLQATISSILKVVPGDYASLTRLQTELADLIKKTLNSETVSQGDVDIIIYCMSKHPDMSILSLVTANLDQSVSNVLNYLQGVIDDVKPSIKAPFNQSVIEMIRLF